MAYNIFLIICLGLCVQAIGFLFLYISKIGNKCLFFKRLFLTQIFGVFLLIVLYAIYITQGKTIFILLLIPITYFFIYHKKIEEKTNQNYNDKGVRWKVIVLVVCLVCSFAYFLSMYSNGIHHDLFYYADISYYLNIFKQEKINIGINVFESTTLGCSPYHYAELWLNAILNNIPNRVSADNMVLVTYPYLLFLVFLGLLALSEETKNSYQIPLFAFIILFAFGFIPDFLQKIPGLQAINYLIFYPMNFSSVKALPICIGYLFFFLMLNGKDLSRSSIFYLSFIPFLSITALPVIYGGSILFSLIMWVKGKREFGPIIGYIVLLLIGFYGFYYFTSITFGENQSVKIDLSLNFISWLGNFLKVFIGIPILMLIAYLAYFILLFFNRSLILKFQNVTLFAIIMLLVSLICWGGTYLNLNTSQIFTVSFLAFFHILIGYLILRIDFFNSYLKFFNIGLVFLITMANSVVFVFTNNFFHSSQKHEKNIEFISKIKNRLPKEKEEKFVVAYFKDPKFYGNNFEEGVGTARGLYLHYIRNDIQLVGLNEPRAELSDNIYSRRIQVFLLSQHPFYNLFMKERVSLEELGSFQVQFLKRNRINYVYVESGVILPLELKSIVNDSIIDENSGDNFLILK